MYPPSFFRSVPGFINSDAPVWGDHSGMRLTSRECVCSVTANIPGLKVIRKKAVRCGNCKQYIRRLAKHLTSLNPLHQLIISLQHGKLYREKKKQRQTIAKYLNSKQFVFLIKKWDSCRHKGDKHWLNKPVWQMRSSKLVHEAVVSGYWRWNVLSVFVGAQQSPVQPAFRRVEHHMPTSQQSGHMADMQWSAKGRRKNKGSGLHLC